MYKIMCGTTDRTQTNKTTFDIEMEFHKVMTTLDRMCANGTWKMTEKWKQHTQTSQDV